MSEVNPSQAQHGSTSSAPGPAQPPLWRLLLDSHARRRKQWLAQGDLIAEQLAAQGGATLRIGLHLWGESLRAGVEVTRSSCALGLDTFRRSLEILR